MKTIDGVEVFESEEELQVAVDKNIDQLAKVCLALERKHGVSRELGNAYLEVIKSAYLQGMDTSRDWALLAIAKQRAK